MTGRFAERLSPAYIARMRAEILKEVPYMTVHERWKDAHFWTRMRAQERFGKAYVPKQSRTGVIYE